MVGREIHQQYPPRQPSLGPTVLEVRGLSVPASGERRGWAAVDVSFDLRRGEILGLAGLQGSGKSELAHGLFGSFGPGVRGRTVLDGRPFAPASPAASIGRGLALLTADRKVSGLVPVMSVGRNITLASLPAFSPGGWIRAERERRAAEAAFRAFDIRARSLAQDVSTLSGGNQQKVVLAKWMQTSPRVLLLDEPTIGVDIGAKHEIYGLMNRWTAEGLAILLITSDLPELLALSDRVLVLHRGRAMALLDRAEATQERVLAAAMGQEERT
jgi:ABC-type sugar transport system ATPase subunit